MHELLYPILIFLAGASAGFINVMAGGGSVLTLSILLLAGLDGSVANGTNRIAILSGTLSGSLAYKSEKFTGFKESLKYALATLPGALIGAFFAIKISNVLFQRLLIVVMVIILMSILLPKSKQKNQLVKSKVKKAFIYPSLFLIGLYGGFIQAGIGFFIMAAFRHLSDLNLIRINLHKLFIVFFYSIPVILIFVFSNNIHWLYALTMASGQALGAWISAKISIRKGEGIVKVVLGLVILLMIAKFIFI